MVLTALRKPATLSKGMGKNITSIYQNLNCRLICFTWDDLFSLSPVYWRYRWIPFITIQTLWNLYLEELRCILMIFSSNLHELSWELLDNLAQSNLCDCCESKCKSRRQRSVASGMYKTSAVLHLFGWLVLKYIFLQRNMEWYKKQSLGHLPSQMWIPEGKGFVLQYTFILNGYIKCCFPNRNGSISLTGFFNLNLFFYFWFSLHFRLYVANTIFKKKCFRTT